MSARKISGALGQAARALPDARNGVSQSAGGRPIVAGIAPHARMLSARATDADLWAPIEALTVDPHGCDRLQDIHASTLDANARLRLASFVSQAREYYVALRTVNPVAKPLLGYYFALNLTKAYITAVTPDDTKPDKLMHGLESKVEPHQNYWFRHEYLVVKRHGVFPTLALLTGQGFVHSDGHQMRIIDLMPFLIDGYDLYADAEGKAPNLIPIDNLELLFNTRAKEAWLRVEIRKGTLGARNLTRQTLLTRAAAFGNWFHLVDSKNSDYHTYESKTTESYKLNRLKAARLLCIEFDEALIGVRRNVRGGLRYLVLEGSYAGLLSHEAVTFAMLLHLSNMVRYRPFRVEKLRGKKEFWLFASWVDRACENYLLSLAARITGEEHCIE